MAYKGNSPIRKDSQPETQKAELMQNSELRLNFPAVCPASNIACSVTGPGCLRTCLM
jgi:hypothetical protein